ncbi:MAG: hypothetical protein H0W90_01370 [Actinobacteria bacterium]|nr:hypothetical protein [Actinomycetota bacterium]
MTAAPSWARGTKPSIEENAQEEMRQDVAAGRQHLRGVGHLPLDPESARFELTEEERANRGSRPLSRRWRTLNRLDEEVDRITQRHAEATGRLTAAEEALNRAPESDARTLAAWLSGGEKGDRPSATVYEKTRDRDAAQLLVAAVAVELDQKLEQRLQHVAKHREKMLADARKDIDQAREALSSKVNELAPLRQQLADAREVLLWAASYPGHLDQFGFPDAVALGLREPVERTLSTRAQIAYVSLIAALEEDMAALASAFSDEQKRQLGHPDEATPISTAMWNDDPRAAAWRKQELERARTGRSASTARTLTRLPTRQETSAREHAPFSSREVCAPTTERGFRRAPSRRLPGRVNGCG